MFEEVKYTVIGYRHAKGTYNGNDYDNFNIHCTRDCNSANDEVGTITEVFKIKASAISELPAIDSVIIPVYDRFGRVVGYKYVVED